MSKPLVLGCIGCGNMGGAVLKGLRTRFDHESLHTLGFDHSPAKVEAAGAECATSPENLAARSDIILLAVKPYQIEAMLATIVPHLSAQNIVLSVAGGVTMETLRQAVAQTCPVVRIMPNLPAMVGKGLFALCFDDPTLSDAQKTLLLDIFQALGQALALPESQFSAFTAVAGCGPAYQMLFMEGMLNAAITMGLPAETARRIITATCEGSAVMADQTQIPFATLREQVCSPAGSTIQAVNYLELNAVRGHICAALLRAYAKDKE